MPYDGDDLRAELERIMRHTRPTIVALPNPLDRHPDHRAAGLFTLLAIADWSAAHPTAPRPQLFAYLVHWPDWPPGWDAPATDPSRPAPRAAAGGGPRRRSTGVAGPRRSGDRCQARCAREVPHADGHHGPVPHRSSFAAPSRSRCSISPRRGGSPTPSSARSRRCRIAIHRRAPGMAHRGVELRSPPMAESLPIPPARSGRVVALDAFRGIRSPR